MISDFPLYIFTVLTGLAAGGYVGAAVLPKQAAKADRSWVFPVIALVLIAIGGAAAFTHLGRPELALNMLGNLASPLMLEGATSGCLAVVAIIDLILCRTNPNGVRAIRIIGAIVGIICMCTVTYAYTTTYGNPAWVAPSTYPLFAIGDLAAGVALWVAVSNCSRESASIITGVLNALFTCALAWQAAVFAGFGVEGVACIIAGAVIAALAAVVAFISIKAKGNRTTWLMVVAVISIVALVVSRYGFYMASII